MNISQESSLSEDEDDDIRFKQTCHSDTDESGDEMMKGDFQLKNNRNSSEHNNSTELNKLEKEKQLVYRHSLFPLLGKRLITSLKAFFSYKISFFSFTFRKM